MTAKLSMKPIPLAVLLKSRFSAKHVDATLEHYQTMIGEFQKGEWETCIVRAGKLIESVLKCLWVLVGGSVPRGRDFKVDVIIRQLEKTPTPIAEDAIRLTIPRACRFIYDIASNRGARHDPDGIDPNEMDATAVVSTGGWVVAEMLRISQKGTLHPSKAKELVQGLIQKRFPIIEEVDGRTYFHVKGVSARTIGLLTLWRAHPERISRDELLANIRRHGFSEDNARKGVSRLRSLVDDDESGSLKLLLPGLNEAENLIASTRNTSFSRS